MHTHYTWKTIDNPKIKQKIALLQVERGLALPFLVHHRSWWTLLNMFFHEYFTTFKCLFYFSNISNVGKSYVAITLSHTL
jgi:hypothetical protein